MKKCLLIAFAVTLSVSVAAQQQRLINAADKISVPNKKKEMVEKYQRDHSSVLPGPLLNNRRIASGVNGILVNQAILDTLGNAPSYRTGSIANRNCLWYDQDVNALVFIHHRINTSPGFIAADISKDGGNTWTYNQGPINDDLWNITQYPEAVIGNPLTSGNTVADSAYLIYSGYFYAPSFDDFRRGQTSGQAQLNLSNCHNICDTVSRYIATTEDIFTVKFTGDIWKIAHMQDTTNKAYNYLDSLVLTHGVWNSTTKSYDYTEKGIFLPVDTANLGLAIDVNIAFDDFGSNGYIAMITSSNSFSVYPDSILYLSVLKSVDGGNTWNYANSCPRRPDIIDLDQAVDTLLAHDSTITYGTAFDMDIVVDQNSNLHILTAVIAGAGYSVFAGDSLWAMFDVYTEDLGNTWKAQKLAQPMTFRGNFGDGSTTNPTSGQDNRPFASRNWDGNKLFFSWFDTDTILFGTSPDGRDNKFPDLHTMGYDVATMQWTPHYNLTSGTDAEGQCTFGFGSYYVIDSALTGTTFSIPAAFMQLADPLQTGSPTQFWYIENANITWSATTPGNPVTLACSPDRVQQFSISSSFSVSANYPNPFNGKTSFDITLANASDVSVEVTNMLGEVVSMNKYSKMTSGMHTLTIDGNKLTAGIYIYKVQAGNDVVSKKMTIQ